MKKFFVMAVAAAAVALSLSSCADDTERCWKVTSSIAGAETTVPSWATKAQMQDAKEKFEAANTLLGSNVSYSYVAATPDYCGK